MIVTDDHDSMLISEMKTNRNNQMPYRKRQKKISYAKIKDSIGKLVFPLCLDILKLNIVFSKL